MALAQTTEVAAALRRAIPGLEPEIVRFSPMGDRDQISKLDRHGGKGGAFVSEIRDAMRRGELQCAMHSLKDMPGDEEAPGFVIAAYLTREPAGDVLVVRRGLDAEEVVKAKAAGLKIGKSLAEPDLLDEAKAVILSMTARGAAVPIPTDVVTAKEFKSDAKATVKAAADVQGDDMILDIGPQTAQQLAEQLESAGTIVWNGPVGVFEFPAFEAGTKRIAKAIAESDAYSLAGGGDTLAAIAKYGIEKKIDYISTGGGAFLEVLEGKTLPAFEILARRAKA